MMVASNEDYWRDYQALEALCECSALTNDDVIKILDDWQNGVQDYEQLFPDDLLKNPNLHEETRIRIRELFAKLGYA